MCWLISATVSVAQTKGGLDYRDGVDWDKTKEEKNGVCELAFYWIEVSAVNQLFGFRIVNVWFLNCPLLAGGQRKSRLKCPKWVFDEIKQWSVIHPNWLFSCSSTGGIKSNCCCFLTRSPNMFLFCHHLTRNIFMLNWSASSRGCIFLLYHTHTHTKSLIIHASAPLARPFSLSLLIPPHRLTQFLLGFPSSSSSAFPCLSR